MNKSDNKLFRALAFILGIAFIIFGLFLGFQGGVGDFKRILHIVVFLGVGIYFINFSFTGRSTIGRYK